MRRLLRALALLLFVAVLAVGCGATSSGGRSASVRCLDRGAPAGQGALTASDQPDRPLFFLFCVQSP
jgi:hypothetical protein